MSEERLIRRDRMRFTKNTPSSRLALLAIVLNVLFFVSIYRVNVDDYYTWLIGISILYNLVFMLAAFLASEGVKNYKIQYSWLLAVLAAGQIVRIFILPAMMHTRKYTETIEIITKSRRGADIKTYETIEKLVMVPEQYTRVIIYLCLSALCLLAAAGINWYKCRELSAAAADSDVKQV